MWSGVDVQAACKATGPVRLQQEKEGRTLTLQVLFLGRHHFMSGGFADSPGHI